MQFLSVSDVRFVSSVVIVAALAAGCNTGAIGGSKEEPGAFSPAAAPIDASIAASEDSTSAPDTQGSIDEAVADSTAVDTGAIDSSAPDTTIAVVDTGAKIDSATPVDTGTPIVDTGTAVDTYVAIDTAPPLVWRKANLTWYTSYPDPGSAECIEYSGCEWAGQFAALPDKMPESWVKANNIASVHGKDFATYKLKTLRLRQGTKQIDVKVYDMCADTDCSGCCTKNSSTTGFLIDIEKYTAERFGTNSGIVEWTCLDC